MHYQIGHNGGPSLDKEPLEMTKDDALEMDEKMARSLVGHWWKWHQAYDLLQSREGRATIHRTWLRYSFNNEPELIPTTVLASYAVEKPRFNARDWFARALASRQ
jgi:hypothetical protein